MERLLRRPAISLRDRDMDRKQLYSFSSVTNLENVSWYWKGRIWATASSGIWAAYHPTTCLWPASTILWSAWQYAHIIAAPTYHCNSCSSAPGEYVHYKYNNVKIFCKNRTIYEQFGQFPMDTFCTNCQKNVRTSITKETSQQAYWFAIILCICWWVSIQKIFLSFLYK